MVEEEIDMQRDMGRLEEILESMERKNHSDNLDNSDEEEESPQEEEEDPEEVRVLKMLMKVGSRPRVEVPMYEGNLNVEELMESIHALNKYFEFEEIEGTNKVRYAATRMKGHATIWWDEVHIH